MKFLLATKQSMTQFFDENGVVTPATRLLVEPATITQIKNEETDGYRAVQVSFGATKKVTKAREGHLKDVGPLASSKEFRLDKTKKGSEDDYKVGETIAVTTFEAGDDVTVSGISKGKGFQGVVKRHNFGGGPRSHGQRHSEREPGSIGATGPQRVFKGTKMAGRMGADRVTVKGLKVLAVNEKTGEILVSGAVPGRRGTLIELRG